MGEPIPLVERLVAETAKAVRDAYRAGYRAGVSSRSTALHYPSGSKPQRPICGGPGVLARSLAEVTCPACLQALDEDDPVTKQCPACSQAVEVMQIGHKWIYIEHLNK